MTPSMTFMDTPSSCGGTFPFEKLPPEVRNEIYGCLLRSPDGWFNILSPSALADPEEKISWIRKEPSDEIHLGLLKINKAIRQEAESFLYGSNVFHFFFKSEETPVTFLSTISETARQAITHIGMWVEFNDLTGIAPRYGRSLRQVMIDMVLKWVALCRYLKQKTSIQRLTLIVMNRTIINTEHMHNFNKCSRSYHPWVDSLASITGIWSLNIHTANCPSIGNDANKPQACPTIMLVPRGKPIGCTSKIEQSRVEKLWRSEDMAFLQDNLLQIGRRGLQIPQGHRLSEYWEDCQNGPLGPCFPASLKSYLHAKMCTPLTAAVEALDAASPEDCSGRGAIADGHVVEESEETGISDRCAMPTVAVNDDQDTTKDRNTAEDQDNANDQDAASLKDA